MHRHNKLSKHEQRRIKSNKLPEDYNRNFFVYGSIYDIYGNKVVKEELYEGSYKRFIYWIPNRQK